MARVSIQTQSVTEQIAHCLADEIIHGRLDSGERIAEQSWAAELDVSRGSVREALLLLERWHLVTIQPRRGARVQALTEQWAREIAEAWFLILDAVAAWLVKHGGRDSLGVFDEALDQLREKEARGDLEGFYESSMRLALEATEQTGHGVYTSMMRNLMPAARRCFYFALIHSRDQTRGTIDFVSELADAVRAADRQSAVRVIHEFQESEMARIAAALRASEAEPASGIPAAAE